ncbi:MAG: CopG family transcriptional regulator [Candidatus Omnitrophota bacterium]
MEHIRSTLYLDRDVHRALKIRTAMLEMSVSKYINWLVRRAMKEDRADLKAFKERAKDKETSLDTFIEELKKDELL